MEKKGRSIPYPVFSVNFIQHVILKVFHQSSCYVFTSTFLGTPASKSTWDVCLDYRRRVTLFPRPQYLICAGNGGWGEDREWLHLHLNNILGIRKLQVKNLLFYSLCFISHLLIKL
jgi:hypothetical protein